ncbi:hypothetical protein THAOC_20541 [Thalassiosira oceanica]|uniref:Uncharacterized protein n=1 Tax=Thalassiosira oceanica TaxID=159749 RepID=K0SLC0_THAOC|nr:hypothetical protein THAOC_20541 [Thalassiosira oceanica]|eukprot:EJK59262.1 hypothetical protein THAOC_20541 [Thalassiosira oceanica]
MNERNATAAKKRKREEAKKEGREAKKGAISGSNCQSFARKFDLEVCHAVCMCRSIVSVAQVNRSMLMPFVKNRKCKKASRRASNQAARQAPVEQPRRYALGRHHPREQSRVIAKLHGRDSKKAVKASALADVVYTKEVAVVAAGRPWPLATDKGQSSGGTARNRGKVLRQQQSSSIAGKGIGGASASSSRAASAGATGATAVAIPTAAISRKDLAASNAVARQNCFDCAEAAEGEDRRQGFQWRPVQGVLPGGEDCGITEVNGNNHSRLWPPRILQARRMEESVERHLRCSPRDDCHERRVAPRRLAKMHAARRFCRILQHLEIIPDLGIHEASRTGAPRSEHSPTPAFAFKLGVAGLLPI